MGSIWNLRRSFNTCEGWDGCGVQTTECYRGMTLKVPAAMLSRRDALEQMGSQVCCRTSFEVTRSLSLEEA